MKTTTKTRKPRKGGSLQRLVRHSWRDHDVMYVIGCIDSNGAIVANPSREGRTHRPEESKGKRWRWCVWSQEMAWGIPGRTLEEINNPRLNELTDEESFAVWDWLRKHGYTDDRSMPN